MEDAATTKDNAPITVVVQLTAGDLNDLWSGSGVRHVVWILIPFGLLYLYFAFATIVNDGLTTANALTVTLYCVTALIALFPGSIISRARSRLMIRYGPTLSESRQFSLSDRGVDTHSELMTCHYQWGAFSRVAESRRSFLLYQTPISGMVIPKRCFTSSAEIGQFRVLLRNQFKGKLRLRD